MKRVWINPWFVWPVMVFFVIAIFIELITPYGNEILFLNPWREGWLNPFFRRATHLGEVPAFIVAGMAAMFWRFRFTLLIALAGLITSPLVYTLKDKIGTDRPKTYFEKTGLSNEVVVVPEERLNSGQTSFPSGHTMAAFGLYGLLTLMLDPKARRWGLLLALLAVLVGFSRIFLVQHFLRDVLGGAIMGLMIAWLVWQFDQLPFMRHAAWLDKRLIKP